MNDNTKATIKFLSIVFLVTLAVIAAGILAAIFHHHSGRCKSSSLPLNASSDFNNRTHWRVDLIKNSSWRHGVYGSDLTSSDPSGVGMYLVRAELGNPAQTQHLSIDTGSDITWVQCKGCKQCYRQVDDKYNPSTSTSFCQRSCGSKACKLFGESRSCHYFPSRCHYRAGYLDGSFSKGVVMIEQIKLGGGVAEVAMGCGIENVGLFTGSAAGIMGLGNGQMSIVNQLDHVGLRGGFTYCLGSSTDLQPGWLQFGPWSFSIDATWVPLVSNPKNPSSYYIELIGIAVGDVRLPIPNDAFRITKSGGGGVVLDTGTVITRFPRYIYELLRDEFKVQCFNLPAAPAYKILDTCYYFHNQTSKYPTISFYFPGTIYTLRATGIFIKIDKWTHCLAFAPAEYSGYSIIGNVQQEGIQMSYDLRRGLVGFGPTKC